MYVLSLGVSVEPVMPGSQPALRIPTPQVLTHLAGMPELNMKWQTAAAPLASNPPIVRLLGYFTAGQTDKAATLLQVGSARAVPSACCVPVGTVGSWAQ